MARIFQGEGLPCEQCTERGHYLLALQKCTTKPQLFTNIRVNYNNLAKILLNCRFEGAQEDVNCEGAPKAPGRDAALAFYALTNGPPGGSCGAKDIPRLGAAEWLAQDIFPLALPLRPRFNSQGAKGADKF